MNKVIIKGNLTKDVEQKALPSGTSVSNFSVATNRVWNDKATGEKKEEVEFHNIVAFGKQAEVISQYFKKGSQILLEGRLKTQSWEDKETTKKMYRTEVILEQFEFCGTKADNQNNGGLTGQDAQEVKAIVEQAISQQEDTDVINPEDIPF